MRAALASLGVLVTTSLIVWTFASSRETDRPGDVDPEGRDVAETPAPDVELSFAEAATVDAPRIPASTEDALTQGEASTEDAANDGERIATLGSVRGTMLLDEDVTFRAIAASALRQGDAELSLDRVPARYPDEILLPRIKAGLYTVWVYVQGDPTPLVTLHDIPVRGAELSEPEAMNPLDLRGVVKRHEVFVFNADDKPLIATVYYRSAGQEGMPWVRASSRRGNWIGSDASEPTPVYSRGGPVDVIARATGHALGRMADVMGQASLVLHDAHKVRVRLVKGPELREDWKLAAQLKPVDDLGGILDVHGESASFDADGTCLLEAPTAGAYVVEILALGTIRVRHDPTRGPAPEVYVTPGQIPEVQVEADPKAIQAALQWFSDQAYIE